MQLTDRFGKCESMLKSGQQVGALPPVKEVYKTVFDMAWPAILEMVLVSLIASVDTMMVGAVGVDAIAAVGITTQPKFILQAFVLSLNTGVTAIVSRRKGQEDRLGANSCLSQAFMISLIASAVISLFGFMFARPILHIAGAENDIIDDAAGYFRIITVGLFFFNLSLTINAAQRGIGNTKISMRTNILANVVNLVFNYLLIGGNFGFPRLGVRGAAIATMLGNIVAFFISLHSVTGKNGFLHIKLKALCRFDKKTLLSLTDISSSVLVEQLFLRFGFFSSAIVVAKLGTMAFSIHQICASILDLSTAFGNGLTIASTALVGQSLGKNRPDMAIIYGKATQRFAMVISIGLFLLFTFGKNLLVGLYTDDRAVMEAATSVMVLAALITYVQSSNMVMTGSLRGAGDTKFVTLLSICGIGIFRPVMAYVLAIMCGLGLIGVWIVMFLDCGGRMVIAKIRFSRGKWTKRVI